MNELDKLDEIKIANECIKKLEYLIKDLKEEIRETECFYESAIEEIKKEHFETINKYKLILDINKEY